MSRISKVHNWLNSEIEKDKIDLKKDKEKLINELKSLKKDDLFKQKQIKKISFWERIKKVFF